MAADRKRRLVVWFESTCRTRRSGWHCWPACRCRRWRRWRSGLASVLDHDDPLARARWLADTLGPLHRADPTVARLLGTDLLTIRIDLEPSQPDG
jgi:hypothetical protein